MPLNEEELGDFLTTGNLNIHLATVNERGHANIHPAWYYYDRSNDKIYVQNNVYQTSMDFHPKGFTSLYI